VTFADRLKELVEMLRAVKDLPDDLEVVWKFYTKYMRDEVKMLPDEHVQLSEVISIFWPRLNIKGEYAPEFRRLKNYPFIHGSFKVDNAIQEVIYVTNENVGTAEEQKTAQYQLISKK
jgi:hypothetical protein